MISKGSADQQILGDPTSCTSCGQVVQPNHHFASPGAYPQSLRFGSRLRHGPAWRVNPRNIDQLPILGYKVVQTYTGWWCNNHLEKYESQWEGWHPIYYGKKMEKNMFQTTNQYIKSPAVLAQALHCQARRDEWEPSAQAFSILARSWDAAETSWSGSPETWEKSRDTLW